MRFKEWKERKVHLMPRWAVLIYGLASFLGGFNLIYIARIATEWAHRINWASEITAAWVQAFGSIAAIFCAIGLAMTGAAHQKKAIKSDRVDRAKRALVLIDNFVVDAVGAENLKSEPFHAQIPYVLEQVRHSARAVAQLEQGVLPTAELLSRWLLMEGSVRGIVDCYEKLLSLQGVDRVEVQRVLDVHRKVMAESRGEFALRIGAI
tara:strand:+ start:1858 stop:2478 length:621 start_codon:yes stop_codon:yes gene_type:complete